MGEALQAAGETMRFIQEASHETSQALAEDRGTFANWDRSREPAYAAALEAWRDQYFALLVDIDRSLSPEQRSRVLLQLRRYAEEFDTLAAR